MSNLSSTISYDEVPRLPTLSPSPRDSPRLLSPIRILSSPPYAPQFLSPTRLSTSPPESPRLLSPTRLFSSPPYSPQFLSPTRLSPSPRAYPWLLSPIRLSPSPRAYPRLLSPIKLSTRSRRHRKGDSPHRSYTAPTGRSIIKKWKASRRAKALDRLEKAAYLRAQKKKTVKKPRRGDHSSHPIIDNDDDRQMAVLSASLPPLHIPPMLCEDTNRVHSNFATITAHSSWWKALERNAQAQQGLSPSNQGTAREGREPIDVIAPGIYPGH